MSNTPDILQAFSSQGGIIDPRRMASLLRRYVFGRRFRLPRRAVVGFSYMGWFLRQVKEQPGLRNRLAAVMDRLGIAYHQGDVWTTDAFFRETTNKVQRFRHRGAVCVDMEAASLFAVAQHRGIDLACLFCGGDSVAGRSWKPRLAGEMHPDQQRLLDIACRALTERACLEHNERRRTP
ncbi:MAG: hypothetical protein Q8P22_03585 [Chloroflexota bacterium]|nr:hypothetical protein [Chloroflexota bacterium]